jgi:hypothetical protein
VFKILRSVKQGDSLSCALFILCLDPLIRNIENNQEILRADENTPGDKAGGYADDIFVIIKNDLNSLQNIFKEYERFGKCSGLILNADKTEILPINCNVNRFGIRVYESEININTVDKLKICGKTFSNNYRLEVEANVHNIVTKMENILKGWLPRNLTIEGKIILTKTFGLSQIIHIMQSTFIDEIEKN